MANGNQPFAMIPEQLLYSGCPGSTIKVYGALLRHGSTPEDCYPSVRRLATLTQLSPSSVQRALDYLSDHGWIERVPRMAPEGDHDSNSYVVNAAPGGCTAGDTTCTAGDTTCTAGDTTGVPLVTRGCTAGDSLKRAIEREPRERETTTPPVRSDRGGRFEEFWGIYPRRVAKGAAQKAWAKALTRADAPTICLGAERYRDDPTRTPQYTAHPATWLNADRWLDEITEPTPVEPKGWAVLREMHEEEQLHGQHRDDRGHGSAGGSVPHLRVVEAHGRDLEERPVLGAPD